MKIFTLVCSVLLLGCAIAFAQTPATEPGSATPVPASTPLAAAPSVSPAPTIPDDEQSLLAIEQEWSNANLHGDADYLSRLVTDDFVSTNGRGETNNKAAELKGAHDRTVHYTVFENHDMTVHLYNNAAIITGRTRLKGTISASGKLAEAEAQFTHFFIRVDNHWRAAGAHTSRMGD